jgi:hypothetical protein
VSTVTAGQQAARFAADLIRFDTTNRGERIPLSALEASVRIMDRFLAPSDE